MQRRKAGERSTADDSGYAMAALLVAMAVMAVFLSVALPAWRTQAQREKETELIFRGTQYAHAIALFQRKYANAAPPSIEVLVNQRFLRKKYKDPMTKDGEFQVLLAGQGTAQPSAGGQAGRAGGPTTTGGTVPTQGQPTTRTATQVGTGTTVAATGGIVGVASKSTDDSIRIYNGHSKYNEWVFVATQSSTGINAPNGSQTPTGGVNLPGGGTGANGRGGRGGLPVNPGRGPQPGGRQNPQGPQRGFGPGTPFDGGGFGGGGFGGGQRGR